MSNFLNWGVPHLDQIGPESLGGLMFKVEILRPLIYGCVAGRVPFFQACFKGNLYPCGYSGLSHS